MITTTRKVYQNSSNGQLLITVPNIFNKGDEVVLTLSKNAYEVIEEKDLSINSIYSQEARDYIISQLKFFWEEDLNDFLTYNYAEDCVYENYEDLESLGLEVDLKLGLCSGKSIGFTIRLTKRTNWEVPNKEMIKKIQQLMNKDFDEIFKKRLQETLDY